MDEDEDEYRREMSRSLEELHRKMLDAGQYDHIPDTDFSDKLSDIHQSVEGLRDDLRQALDAIHRVVSDAALERADHFEELSGIREELQGIKKEAEATTSSVHTLGSEVQNIESAVEAQGEYTRMSIGDTAKQIGCLLQLLVIAAIFMVVRFWPSEWSIPF